MRGTTINLDVQLVVEECFSCHVTFAMPQTLRDRALEKKAGMSFYCPNGHGQHYTGKTEEQKQRERAERLEQTVAARERDLRFEQRRLTDERRSHAATKGVLTKTKKRATNGVCPVEGCKRHFANVERHIANKHPEHLAR